MWWLCNQQTDAIIYYCLGFISRSQTKELELPMHYLIDQIEAYYIDVLGWSQDDCSQYTSDELLDMLTPDQRKEFNEYTTV